MISKHSTFFLFLFIRKHVKGTRYLVITCSSLCLCVREPKVRCVMSFEMVFLKLMMLRFQSKSILGESDCQLKIC